MCAKQYRQLASDVDPQLRIGFVAGGLYGRAKKKVAANHKTIRRHARARDH
jgi:hypothetical protein